MGIRRKKMLLIITLFYFPLDHTRLLEKVIKLDWTTSVHKEKHLIPCGKILLCLAKQKYPETVWVRAFGMEQFWACLLSEYDHSHLVFQISRLCWGDFESHVLRLGHPLSSLATFMLTRIGLLVRTVSSHRNQNEEKPNAGRKRRKRVKIRDCFPITRAAATAAAAAAAPALLLASLSSLLSA
ncbi:hypothetical protein QQP08_026294 [Theobroma cacao]|nr:hypothetical protein QQP08_026294 [Theobroma cacao]